MKKLIIIFQFLYILQICSENLPQSHFLLKREGHSICYDGRLRQPSWVCEFLSKDSIHGQVKRTGMRFIEDKEIPITIRSRNKDYRHSGYDRGHMAPAGDFRNSKQAMANSFLLSNISPQFPLLNRGYWIKIEERVRKIVDVYGNAIVITGPLFIPEVRSDGRRFVSYEVIGDSQIAVPSHYFKFIKSGEYEEGYIVPNASIPSTIPLENLRASLKKIEKIAGMTL